MSVYRPKGKDGKAKSRFYHYDFTLKVGNQSCRFHGSTGQKTQRAAEKVEARLRELAATGQLTSDMTLAAACHRYFEEVLISKPSAGSSATHLEHCCRLIGNETLLVDISTEKIADAMRRRAGEYWPVRRKKPFKKGEKPPPRKPIGPVSVNKVAKHLRSILRRAAKVWGVPVRPDLIPWEELALPEPGPRKREFIGDEADRFWRAMRPDYWPLCRFYLLTGLRLSAAIGLRRENVDLEGKRILVRLKSKDPGGRWEWLPLSDEACAILATEMTRSDGPIWTYVVLRGNKLRRIEIGNRQQITIGGFRHVFDDAIAEAGIVDFHRHDMRHDFARKLLRQTHDLMLVKKALKHRNIQSTMVYVDVLDEDVREGLNVLADATSRNSPGVPNLAEARAAKKAQ